MEMSLVTGDMVTRSKSVIPIANADITTAGKGSPRSKFPAKTLKSSNFKVGRIERHVLANPGCGQPSAASCNFALIMKEINCNSCGTVKAGV
jgi:hypothetical protein